ncbi:peptidase MA family metallohydrolase [Alkaliphilus transvaalensis]|uniref:peptidase MA family metallohydrolase n=1 Tax=Alkaliphilus transvaalensis TaxID=114628 RepID=UPI00047AC8B5|nr:hypothetical protein [Alkaliphilus transvaalensis]
MIKSLRNNTSNLKLKICITLLILIMSVGGYLGQVEVLRVMRPIIRNVENLAVSFQVRNYHQLETDHFIIKYNNIDEDILALVAYTAESKYQQAVKIFQYEPKSKISLVLYDEPAPMMKVTMLRKGTPPMGVYYGDTLHILDPTHWVKDEERLEELFYNEGPVLHELIHLFTDHLGKGNFPIWFTEGVSLYFEYEIDGYEWGKWVEFRDDEFNLTDLTNSFHQLDQFKAYTRSFRIIKNFVEEEGINTLIQLIHDLGNGENLENYYHLFKY